MNTRNQNATNVMETKRARREKLGMLVCGTPVVNVNDGKIYICISGKPDGDATIVSQEHAKKAIIRKVNDEKKNPMLAGTWNQYVLKSEKVIVKTNDLVSEEIYHKAINTNANKATLKKLETAETKKATLQTQLEEINLAITNFNQELVSSMKNVKA